MALFVTICGRGDVASRPTAETWREGHLYLQTDSTPGFYRCDGAAWELVVATAAATVEGIQDIVGALVIDTSDIDFTYNDGSDQLSAVVANDAVTNAKMANMAEARLKGRASGAGTGDPTDLTGTQATAILDNVVGDSGSGGTKGLVPAPAAGDAAASKFLKADGAWTVVSGTTPAGSAGGDLAGTYPNPTVAKASNSFAFTGDISPSQITSNQNDYDPTNLSTSTVLRLNSDAARTITGLAGGADGRVISIINIGSFPITLAANSGSSSGSNQFGFASDAVLPPKAACVLIYDATSSLWREASAPRKKDIIKLVITDETSTITAGSGKLIFRMPYSMLLTEVRAELREEATAGTFTVDINESGSTILSTALTIDANQKTSVTAGTPAVISDSVLAEDAEIRIDVDDAGSGGTPKGLKVALIGYRTS